MSELIASVVNGVVQQSNTANAQETTASNELGKDAFLQLLVCQMQNQDPLNPSTDTEFVSQLATFSQLEQLQNLSSSYETSQAFSLVGKNVILETTDANKNSYYVSGTVDFINVSGSGTKLSVNGSLYDMDQLYSVVDDTYLLEKGLPSIETKVELEFDASKPTDLSFEVNLGEGDTKASQVAIALGDNLLDSSMYSLSGNKITLKKEVFEGLGNGEYKPTIVFNDPYYTTATDMVTISVINYSEANTAAGAAEDQPLSDEDLDKLVADA